ncbi:helix-turn-helix transcriptional regulator [Acrocarpospora catenulata]|uniref:helix-turn-helix transcriptional regulator n=1 Tax=Acrocarpospora catenulata TaxID=2836182 RepID=UPI0027DF9367|nr:helix-turn-helix transcriptional regulator [Acrocarpospora catenulata]
MTRAMAAERLVASIQSADARYATVDEFLAAVSGEVRKAVPFDGGLWFGVDPTTLLAASYKRIESMDASYCWPLWHSEFQAHDVLLFRDLARQPETAGSLRMATGDRPLRSTRYREFVRPQGYEDEVRVAFRTGTTTWAVAGLYREKGRPPFDTDALRLLQSISRPVGVALRNRSVSQVPATRGSEALRSPGVLLFNAQGMLMSANTHAKAWLREIYDQGEDSWTILLSEHPASHGPEAYRLQGLVSQAQAVARGHDEAGSAWLRCRDRSGRWVVLHASCMDERDPGSPVAIVIKPAQGTEIVPIIVEAYALTAREREVLRALVRGLSTSDIAAELFLSSHTVRDYIKSVFEKAGVSSRGELTAKLFAEHYFDHMHTSVVHES